MSTVKRNRTRREFERPVDKLVDSSDPDGLTPASLSKFEKRLDRILLKCQAAHAREHSRSINPKANFKNPRFPGLNLPRLNDAEMAVLSEFLEAIMAQLNTERRRRSDRDWWIALDFVFYREVLKHRFVTKKVCARWDISESTVKQAVANEGESARREIPDWRREFERRRGVTTIEERRAAGVTLEEMTFEEMAARQIRSWSGAYRDGTDPDLIPRKRPRAER